MLQYEITRTPGKTKSVTLHIPGGSSITLAAGESKKVWLTADQKTACQNTASFEVRGVAQPAERERVAEIVTERVKLAHAADKAETKRQIQAAKRGKKA